MRRWSTTSVLVAILVVSVHTASAVTWTGGGDGIDWFDSSNWGGSVPAAGQDAVISSGGPVLLSNSTPDLASFTITGATLTFTNWSTALIATNVTIGAGGLVQHATCVTNLVPSNTNRVYLLCSNLTVLGSINVDDSGYRGATNLTIWGQGPGAARDECGGSYGGLSRPSSTRCGPTYGSVTVPSSPGSGGGGRWFNEHGGYGGGAVWVEASGHVLVNGTISARGENKGNNAGGGSGGSIYISCYTFGATNGILNVEGGRSGLSGGHTGWGGGGGRLALHYNTTAQAVLNATAKPFVSVYAAGGWALNRTGRPGTVYLPDAGFFPPTNNVLHGGQIMIPGFSSLSPSSLTIDAGVALFPDDFTLTVTNGLTVQGNGGGLEGTNMSINVGGNMVVNSPYVSSVSMSTGVSVTVGGNLVAMQGDCHFYGGDNTPSTLKVLGDCIVTNGGDLHIHSGATNSITPGYGMLVIVSGDVVITTNSWLKPYSHKYNGGSVKFLVDNVRIQSANCGIDAKGNGFEGGDWYGSRPPGVHPAGYGPGYGFRSGSAGYGGVGAVTNKAGSGTAGIEYGSEEEPLLPGSGGGGYGEYGGNGGGLVWIEAKRTVSVMGSIIADSNDKLSNAGAGGSGGAIYMICKTLAGDGLLTARGGHSRYDVDYSGSSGGGGRIAVLRYYHNFTGTVSVTNGMAYDGPRHGKPGTIYWGRYPLLGVVIVVR